MNEIYVYDDIGPEWAGMISAQSVIDGLAKFKGLPVTLRINSPGGDVHQAMAMYSSIARHPGGVTIEIDGVAASAASYIAMAGAKIRMAENAIMMIHDPWSFALGNAVELRKQADMLDKHGGAIADVYAARSKRPVEDIAAAMRAETWYTAKEAVAAGLADEIGQPLNVSASIKPGRYQHTPKELITNQLPREVVRSNLIVSKRIEIAKKRLTQVA